MRENKSCKKICFRLTLFCFLVAFREILKQYGDEVSIFRGYMGENFFIMG